MEFLSKEMGKKMILEMNAKVDRERKEAKAKAKEDAKAERILKKAVMKEEKTKTQQQQGSHRGSVQTYSRGHHQSSVNQEGLADPSQG